MEFNDIKLKINGTLLPVPVEFDMELSDLDDETSTRDIKTMKLKRNRIRANIYKITLGYSLDETATISLILNLVSDATFEVEMFDIVEMKRVKKTMYAGPKSFGYMLNKDVWVKGLKLSLVEV